MKKKNFLLMFTALTLVSCGSGSSSLEVGTSDSNSISSVESSSEINTSSELITSENQEKQISNGDEIVAIQNPGEWYYNATADVTITNANYKEGVVSFSYQAESPSLDSSVSLLYHDSNFKVDSLIHLDLTLKSSSAGDITINNQVVTLRSGTNLLSIDYLLGESQSAVSIVFKTADKGLIANDAIFVISKVELTALTSVNSIISEANAKSNYTIKYEDGTGSYGEYTFLENAIVFYANDKYYGEANYGFAENLEGIYYFQINGETVVASKDYLKDTDGNVVHGLYTCTKDIVYNKYGDTFMGGLPTLQSLKEFGKEIALTTNTAKTVASEDKNLFKPLLSMCDIFNYSYLLYSQKTVISVGLNADDQLYFQIVGADEETLKFTITNIGTSTHEIISNFISQGTGDSDANPEVVSMLEKINSTNYTFTYSNDNGTNIKVLINENYSYIEQINGGNIKINEEIFPYYIDNGSVVVEQNKVNATDIASLDGLAQYDYFQDASLFKYDETETSYVRGISSDWSFAYSWFNLSTLISKIGIKEVDNKVLLGVFIPSNVEMGINEDSWEYGEISNFNTSTYSLIEDYLQSK